MAKLQMHIKQRDDLAPLLFIMMNCEIRQTDLRGKVKSSHPSLQPTFTWDKQPLGRDLDRSWCYRHTGVKLIWWQLMALWTSAAVYSVSSFTLVLG